MCFIYKYASPLGGITAASNGNALIGLWFDGQKYFGCNLPPKCEEKNLPVFEKTALWLDIFFSGKPPQFALPLSISATPFRRSVWDIIAAVPYGQTITYGEIADIIANANGLLKMSPQAVGGAVAHNPFLLVVPCHRVIGSDGSLTGYAAGISKKSKLLDLEKTGRIYISPQIQEK